MSGSDLGSAFLATARTHPERAALWCGGETLTYAELMSRAGAIAQLIRDHGLARPGDRVAILSGRTATLYVGILAALLAGCAYVPLNARFPLSRNRSILLRSEAVVLIADDRHRPVLGELMQGASYPPAVILPESDAPAGLLSPGFSSADLPPPSAPLPCEGEAGELAYVFFTSGSTGEPKGVPIRHESVFAYLRGIRRVFDPRPEDRLLQLVDVTFDLSVHDMFLAWTSGACLYSVPENAVLLCTRFVEDHDITAWLSVPSTAGLIRQSGLLAAGSMPSLRYSFFCGEALTGAVAAAWAEAAPASEILNIYGPTEATIAITAYRCDCDTVGDMAVVPLGDVFPEQRMALFDPDGTPSPAGEQGEICLAGSQVTDGYWRAPELTAQRFFEAEGYHWYRTGDLGTHDPGVGFRYAGRTDHQVKIRGYRVELQEIEAVVRRVAEQDVVAVVPWPLTADGGALGCVAFVSRVDGDAAALIARCAEQLPDYMVPGRLIPIGTMPLNANGKVDYPALRTHSSLTRTA